MKKGPRHSHPDRRDFLRLGFAGMSCFLGGGLLTSCGRDEDGGGGAAGPSGSNVANLGPLQPADANGVMLPPGFHSRIVARSGSVPNVGGSYPWHPAPDGGAVYTIGDGSWIYVSNSEIGSNGGGAGGLRFDPSGAVVDAYPILQGTNRNCAGGRTPWWTWLSCEESGDGGMVYECDPLGVSPAAAKPAMGRFNHEAVAADPGNNIFYLTEDRPDGGLYRFIPDNPAPDLLSGSLQIAEVIGGGPEGTVVWRAVPDPLGAATPTRYQVAAATSFAGGEGISWRDGILYFATKIDNRIWRLDTTTGQLTILYDDDTSPTPMLTGVDNIELTVDGDVLVAEDGGNMEIVAITPAGPLVPVCRVVGHASSEITGPAFTADHSRLYFSSQRGTTGDSADGVTFEISGPFRI